MGTHEPYESYLPDIGFVGGSYERFNPYDGLDPDQADELRRELEERDAAKIPLGFRPPRRRPSRKVGAWPQVGRL